MRIAAVPSFVSPKTASFAPAVSAISKSNTRSLSGPANTRSVCTLVTGTEPSGAIHFCEDLTTPDAAPPFASRILSCSILPSGSGGGFVPCDAASLQKSTPFTSPCAYHSER